MKEIVEWLITIEGRAAKIYGGLAAAFGGEMKDLLMRLSEDEEEHYSVLKNVFERIGESGFPSLIRVDGGARSEVEERFRRFEEIVAGKGPTEGEALDFIVDIEFSEFNSLFLYAAAALDRKEFMPATAKIRRHKKRVENFLLARGLKGRVERMKGLPELWRERILVVDDEDMIALAVQSVFENECLIATALDGATALKMVNEAYYSAIITDIGLPGGMSGIEFYRRASIDYPSIAERILFFTGSPDGDVLSYLKENNLSYITKPAGIREIKKAVIEVLAR